LISTRGIFIRLPALMYFGTEMNALYFDVKTSKVDISVE